MVQSTKQVQVQQENSSKQYDLPGHSTSSTVIPDIDDLLGPSTSSKAIPDIHIHNKEINIPVHNAASTASTGVINMTCNNCIINHYFNNSTNHGANN